MMGSIMNEVTKVGVVVMTVEVDRLVDMVA